MQAPLEEIRDQQKASWNKFSSGWKKWDELTMDFLKPMGDEIIRFINPSGDDVVLDIAAGTGEPGLSIAKLLDGGKVVSADISDGMLEIARQKAADEDIRNFETIVCDVSELPFPDNSFDAVSCRFGFMFFPDMQMAANEMYRVLRPGGKIAASVWGPAEKNFWVTAILGVINKNMQLPPPLPGAPGMFRGAKQGLIADIFKNAGLKNISEREIQTLLKCGTAETYWTYMTEIGAPVVAALSKAGDEMKELIKNEVYDLINQRFSGGNVVIPASAWVVCGEKS